jgi:cell division protein FtsW
MRIKRIDRTFLFSVLALAIGGLFIFSSAALGILAREGLSFSSIAFKQIAIGGFGGLIALLAVARTDYKVWRRYAFYIFLFSILATLLVFIPGIGFKHGGAYRWISIGSLTFQPVEFLKLGSVIYFAAWASGMKSKINTFRYGFLPLFIIIGLCSILLLKQPDTGNLFVIASALVAMYIVAGGKLRYVLLLALIAAIGLFALVQQRPYLQDRIQTFLDPSADSYGSGYQIQQSLIAIGNGGIFGRGFGQSIQKFSFLPEPIGDSIFAVAAEEFGLLGGVTIIGLFVFFAIRGLKISAHSPDMFGGLLALGIVILVLSQAFLNMGGMLGVLPLKGIPLTFISHGGTAMLFALAEVGIVLNISKYQKS